MAAPESVSAEKTVKMLLDTQGLKNCFDCGICTASCSMAELLGQNYNPRGLLEKIVLDPEKALESDELWLCAWCYRCQERCPQALRLPEILLSMRKIASQRGSGQSYENALRKIVQHVPLPLVTTYLCFHPERSGIRQKETLDKLEAYYDEFLKEQKTKRAQQVSADRIAIIGSGPAGLTAAFQLSLKGYGVTVFEALPEVGGMLRKCIPDYRLPRSVLDKEIAYIKDLGVEFKTNVTIGKDIVFSNLWREGYKAVFIGVGAHKSQGIKIDGMDLKGVIHALEFLWNVNCGGQVGIGKKVAVIGGGNVAMDAATTALKLGAAEVTVLYRRSRQEMPAIPWEIEEAEHAGVKMELLVSPKRILGADGHVTGIELVRTELGDLDESGRRKAVPVEGSEFTRDFDTVILAIGEMPDLEFLSKEAMLNDEGTLYTDPITSATTLERVFAGGDAATGPATVIEAIRAGKRAADSIDDYLKRQGSKQT
jgi:NADPH-dependent glutamate synthase beta subunit-like oxidoreductase